MSKNKFCEEFSLGIFFFVYKMNKTTEKPSLECSIELVTPSLTRHMDVKITIEIDDPFECPCSC